MDDKKKYIIDSLQRQSDIITAFLVLQSLALSYKLSEATFVERLKLVPFVETLTLILHSLFLFGAIIILIKIGRTINNHMDPELQSSLNPVFSSYLKAFVILGFGSIPILLLLKNLLI
jgi:hypothetical protein